MKFNSTSQSAADVSRASADILLVPVMLKPAQKKTPAKKTKAVPQLSETTGRLPKQIVDLIQNRLKTTSFAATPSAVAVIEGSGVVAQRVVLVGLGTEDTVTHEVIRRAAGAALGAVALFRPKTIAVAFNGFVPASLEEAEAMNACVEGMRLASYRFLKYKKTDAEEWKKGLPETVNFIVSDTQQAAMRRVIATAELHAAATITARDLINEPAVHVTPKALSDVAREIGKQSGVTVKILGERDMKRLGMGALLAVSAGSDQEAQFIHLKYVPKKKTNKTKRIALCGKGITFDSGGLSLKPGNYMHGMHMDMAGAASILGLFSVITQLNIDVEAHGVIAATENMISGKATRPGDIATAYDGTTIEITNTDAEGRLVLADAIAWAVDVVKPDVVVDIATLTGAAIYALGQEVAPYFTNNEELHEQLKASGEQAGEQLWRMPLTEEYRPLLKSSVADLDNAPKTIWAGSAMGALFLEHFAKQTPWAHLDIAGPAMVEKQMLPYVPAGGSGFSVRTLIAYLRSVA